MNGIKMIREKLGLNQQQIAEWLGVSRSLVAHYENEMRSLPTTARLKLIQLEIIMANKQQSKPAVKIVHPEALQRQQMARQASQQEADRCAHMAHKLKHQLKNMGVMHEQVMDWLQVLDGLINDPASKYEELDMHWLQAQKRMAVAKMAECDEVAQLELSRKIVGLETTASMLNAEFRIE